LTISGKNVVLVCGIARPEPILSYLNDRVAGIHTLSYNDHHYFVTADLEEIKSAYNNWQVEDKIILTTEKDATRLRLHAAKLAEWGITIAILPIEVVVLFNQGAMLNELITNYVDKEIAENSELYQVG
jgi:tetraacyldisaccharide 4'-kinase